MVIRGAIKANRRSKRLSFAWFVSCFGLQGTIFILTVVSIQ